jgi:hypothetical protein
MPEPHPERPGAGPTPTADQVRADIEALSDLVAESTWVIYGHISYDGEVIVGEYHDAAEAAEILRAAPRAHPDNDRPVP